jgi:hypothetical protein
MKNEFKMGCRDSRGEKWVVDVQNGRSMLKMGSRWVKNERLMFKMGD